MKTLNFFIFLQDHKQLMPSLLTNLFKIMDDIYDSVRRVAYGTTKMYLQVRSSLIGKMI